MSAVKEELKKSGRSEKEWGREGGQGANVCTSGINCPLYVIMLCPELGTRREK
jgi:hypothetical protein